MRGTRRSLTIFVWLVLITVSIVSLPVQAGAAEEALPFSVNARAAVLLDGTSGRILAAFNPDERLEPASLVKVMTLRLAFGAVASGRLKPDDVAITSEKAWRMEGSRMFLEPGEQVTVAGLMEGIAVASGNDATVVLAERLAGDEAAFVKLMNDEAARLGLSDTRFANSNGLTAPDQYMSARDAARLAWAYIRDYPDALALHSQKEFTHNNIRQYNRNGLLSTYQGADGLKTGHTDGAGFNLIATAKRGPLRLIAVVLGAESEAGRESAAARILDYGFANYEFQTIVPAGEPVASARVWKGRLNQVPLVPAGGEVTMAVARGGGTVNRDIQFQRAVVAPVAKGQKLGTLILSQGGREIEHLDLVAAADVPRGGLFKRLVDSIRLFLNGAVKRTG